MVIKNAGGAFGLDFSRHEWLTLAAMVAINFTSGVSTSIYVPFYPKEAEKRGVPASEYGLVFGLYELVAFAVCLLHGKYMDRLGPKFLVNTGTVISGLCSILLGFLYLARTHLVFITLSVFLMVLESATTSAAYTSSYAIVSIIFSKHLATSIAVLETFYGLGFALGPAYGGYLYEVGGFMLPFYAIGLQFLICGIFVFLAVPKIEKSKDNQSKPAQLLPILKMKQVMISLLTLLCAYISIGYLLTTLEPHLRQFQLGPFSVGVMFAVSAVAYILTTPLVGWLCDSYISARRTMMLGSLLMLASFTLLGPLPILPVESTLWMVSLGLILHGLGMSCSVVPAFMDAIQSAIGHGMPDDVTTYCVITALSTSAVALGEFIGPSIAGVLLDTMGFRWGTLLIFVMYIVMFGCLAWEMWKASPSSSQGHLNHGFFLPEQLTSHAHSTSKPVEGTCGSEEIIRISMRIVDSGSSEGKYRSE